MKRLLTGLKPSGELTLGSLIGGISGSVKNQDKYDSYIFVPDMHAITVDQDPKQLHDRIRKNVALYIACGLDPNKNTFYIQSEKIYCLRSEKTELAIACMLSNGGYQKFGDYDLNIILFDTNKEIENCEAFWNE